jgi:hypothetical protein
MLTDATAKELELACSFGSDQACGELPERNSAALKDALCKRSGERLPAAAVDIVVNQHRDLFRSCVPPQSSNTTLTLTFDLLADGSVRTLTASNVETTQCWASAAEKIVFPSPCDPGQVTAVLKVP